jgi:hypothetical protein
MKKSVAIAASAIVAIAFAANQVECGAEEQEQVSDQKVKKASQDSQNKVFRSKLLEIAKVYEGYGRVDDETRWAPYLCRMPMPSIARLSQSDNEETNGQKLYFLFAKNRTGYLAAGSKPSPLGQVIVKEAWKAEEVTGEIKTTWRDIQKRSIRPKKRSLGGSYYPFASKGGKHYRASARVGLYIMFKVDPKTPGTDGGWVYGTITTDGGVLDDKQPLKVTAVGKIESCMSCHRDAKTDRLFGLSASGLVLGQVSTKAPAKQSIDSKEAKAILDAAVKLAASRIEESIGDDWKVTVSGKDVVIERTKPVTFADVEINGPLRTVDEQAAFESARPTRLKPCRYTLRFGDKVTMNRYEKLRAENRAMVKKFDALRSKVRHIHHKFDEYLPSNDEERKQLAEYRREQAKLSFHHLPDLYTMNHSIRLSRSWSAFEYQHEKIVQAQAEELEQTLMRLFGVYDPAVARNGTTLGRYHVPSK